jgi:hypothetical protein
MPDGRRPARRRRRRVWHRQQHGLAGHRQLLRLPRPGPNDCPAGHPQRDIHQEHLRRGTGNKAIALQRDATGATVTDDNIKGPGYQHLVGIDHDTARTGYTRPTN